VTTASSEPADFYRALHEHPPAELLVVDFDETLWLRNSTELFLDSVRPRWLAAMVLQLLGILKPWRLFGRGEPNHYRDWIRVVAVLIVAPWSLWVWRRNAPMLAHKYLNVPLYDQLRHEPRSGICVVSFGFREIIQPLLSAIDPTLTVRESCSLRSGAHLRIIGKAEALRRDVGADRLSRALSITDSEVDQDLLQASGKAFLVQWPDARFAQAGLTPLMPFVYLQKVKRPDENYLRNAIFGHDLPVLLLAFALVSDRPWFAGAALLIFTIGFFTAYEIGYYENDRLGLKLERKPKVSANYHLLGKNFRPRFAWSMAALITAVGSFLAFESHSWVPDFLGVDGVTAFLAVWAAFLLYLVVMRVLFRWQNVISPQGRIVPMLGLQVGRVLGYAIIFPTTVVGAIFCVAHGVARWIPYVVYRFGGSRRDVPNHLNTFLLLSMVAAAVAIGGNAGAILNWQGALIFGYAGLRAAKDMLSFGSKVMPLSGPSDDYPEVSSDPKILRPAE
jgi:hypothetical protein